MVNDYFLFIKNLGDSVVPAFTIISGFLFFRTVKDLSDLKGKYKRRVGSLVIPYIVWNFINTFLLNFSSGLRGHDLLSLNILDNIILWNSSPHFWYIFMLIFWTVFSPILYVLYKNKYGIVFILVSTFSYILFKGNDILGSRFTYILYVWSGLIGYYFPNLFSIIRLKGNSDNNLIIFICFLLYIGIYFIYWHKEDKMGLLVWLYLIRAIILIFILINIKTGKYCSISLYKYSFWFYSIHFWLDVYLCNFFNRFISLLLLKQFVVFTCVCVCAYCLGYFTNKIFPSVFKILSGNR